MKELQNITKGRASNATGSTFVRGSKDKDNPYVMIRKEPLEDVELSWKAKGILAYLLSLPDDWKIYETELVKHSTDGRDSLRSGIKELVSLGYINREREQASDGKFAGYKYTVYEVPYRVGFSDNGLTDNGKPATTNNNTTNNNNTNINISPTKVEQEEEVNITKKEIDTIIAEWNKNALGEIGQIRAINRNTKRYKLLNARYKETSLEDVLEGIRNIPKSNFLQGNNDRGWTIDFDWYIEAGNFIKVLEGKYNDIKEDTPRRRSSVFTGEGY